MARAVEPKLVDAAELLARSDEYGRCELIDGEVVAMAPAGGEHGIFEQRLLLRLAAWSEDAGCGLVLGPSTGYQTAADPDSVRQPDGSWLCPARAELGWSRGFVAGCPDLAIEIVSPSDSRRDVLAKVDTWLAAGTQVVWVVWPAQRELWVWRKHADRAILGPADTLTDPLLPGFALPLARLFKE